MLVYFDIQYPIVKDVELNVYVCFMAYLFTLFDTWVNLYILALTLLTMVNCQI